MGMREKRRVGKSGERSRKDKWHWVNGIEREKNGDEPE